MWRNLKPTCVAPMRRTSEEFPPPSRNLPRKKLAKGSQKPPYEPRPGAHFAATASDSTVAPASVSDAAPPPILHTQNENDALGLNLSLGYRPKFNSSSPNAQNCKSG